MIFLPRAFYKKLALLITLSFSFTALTAQLSKPKLFINCQRARCFETFMQTELTYFTFTRDQGDADIQILVTDQRNASGGINYQLNFLGQNKFEGDNCLIEFETGQADTESIARQKLLDKINQGIYHYIVNTPLVQDIKISFPKGSAEEKEKETEEDPWNNWIFRLSGSGRLEGESNRRQVRVDARFNGGRTTMNSKFSFNTYVRQNSNQVTINEETEVAKVNSYGFNTLYVTSFAKKWSIGGLVKGYHSVYSNINLSTSFAPAIELSLFPIEDFNKEQFRWIYQGGVRNLRYIETTIFDLDEETRPYHQLTSILGYTKPWGNFSAELNGYQYLDDLTKYRLSMEIELSWRISQGLSLRFYGYGSQIQNQISLAKAETGTEELLLGGQQLPTSFDYYTSFGLNYTFGSVNNSIVNPRFSGVN